MKKLILGLFAALALGLQVQAQTIAQIVADSDDHNTLEAALDAANLTSVLDGTDEYTLFAPTDAAFDALPANFVNMLLTDPDGVLSDILLYHVVGGTALSTDLSDGQMVETAFDMQTVMVSIDGSMVMINMSTVTGADIPADNGVVHVIDAVLVPETTTIVDVVVNSDDHNTLEAAVLAAGLETTLGGAGAFTLFAPTDDAFAALPDGLVELLLTDPTGILTDILLYHAIDGIVLSSDLSDGQMAMTINGQDVTVSIDGGDVLINNAQVTVADIVTVNGVVHVVDAVLVPETITIFDVVEGSDDHSTLETALELSGLDETLSMPGSYTLFAPTDAAFEMLPDGVLDALIADPSGGLTDVLLYHALGSIAISTNLMEGSVPTLFGEDIMVSLSSGVMINDAMVTVADIPTINGVVHVIDAVLVPETLSAEEITALEDFRMFPNPAQDQFALELELTESVEVSYDILTLDGRIVKSAYLGNRGAGLNREVINTSNLSEGLYLLEVTLGNGRMVEKLQIVQ